ncbi:MAG: hypothetical protein RL616_1744, partial [Verrucomicrobiota bacterium]
MKKIILSVLMLAGLSAAWSAETTYAPPASPRATLNFNPGWKFIRADVTNAETVAFDDAKWNDVSAPHT